MKLTTSTRIALSAAALACAQTAPGSDIGITKKLMEFDVTQPAREDYREQALGANLIDEAVRRAWRQVDEEAAARLARWLSAPERFGAGISASDLRLTLGRPAAIALQPLAAADPRAGRLAVTIPANRMELISTHPAARGGWMQPRTLVVFDLAATIDFGIVANAPHVRASRYEVALDKVMVLPLNELSALALAADGRRSPEDVRAAYADVLAQAFDAVRLPLARAFNDQMQALARHLALPAGETFNGGAVEDGRIVIAAFTAKPAGESDLAISAAWRKTLGTLMDDCAPLEAGARWISGPRPYGSGEPPRQIAQAFGTYPRADGGDSYSCHSLVRVPAGAPIEITWAQPIRLGSGEPAAGGITLEATPLDFANPVQSQGTHLHHLVLARTPARNVQAHGVPAQGTHAIPSGGAGERLQLSRSDAARGPAPAVSPALRERNP